MAVCCKIDVYIYIYTYIYIYKEGANHCAHYSPADQHGTPGLLGCRGTWSSGSLLLFVPVLRGSALLSDVRPTNPFGATVGPAVLCVAALALVAGKARGPALVACGVVGSDVARGE